MRVQLLEIYNEQLRDLLSDGEPRRLEIRSTACSGLNVPDATQVHPPPPPAPRPTPPRPARARQHLHDPIRSIHRPPLYTSCYDL